MLAITTHCVFLIWLSSARVFAATASQVGEERKLSNKDSLVGQQEGISIFQADLSREPLPTSGLGIGFTLSVHMTLKDYFWRGESDVCSYTRVCFPPEQEYSMMLERSTWNQRRNLRTHPFVVSVLSGRKVKEFMGHASWIDSFTQRGSYIESIGPLQNLDVALFWDTVWHNNVRVIVVIKPPYTENERPEYWPGVIDDNMECLNSYRIKNVGNNKYDGYTCSHLELINLRLKKTKQGPPRVITHCQFTEWPDPVSIPRSTKQLLVFRRHVKELASVPKEQSATPQSIVRPPMLIHSDTTRTRTGTFIAIDVLIDRVDTEPKKPVDVAGVVERLILLQPDFTITEAQYNFCVTALQAHLCQQLL